MADSFEDFELNHHLGYSSYVVVGNMYDSDDDGSSMVYLRGKTWGVSWESRDTIIYSN